jgi:hypothetical protein
MTNALNCKKNGARVRGAIGWFASNVIIYRSIHFVSHFGGSFI